MKKKVKTFEELLGEFTGLNALDKAENEEVTVTENEKMANVETETYYYAKFNSKGSNTSEPCFGVDFSKNCIP